MGLYAGIIFELVRTQFMYKISSPKNTTTTIDIKMESIPVCLVINNHKKKSSTILGNIPFNKPRKLC